MYAYVHGVFALNAGIGQFQQRTEPRHPAVYWPGLQGLVSDPLGWRARLHTREFPFRDIYFAYYQIYSSFQCIRTEIVRDVSQIG